MVPRCARYCGVNHGAAVSGDLCGALLWYLLYSPLLTLCELRIILVYLIKMVYCHIYWA